MAIYTKPFLSLSDQVALLQARGLQIADAPNSSACLNRIGYYRLSSYWYPFRAPSSINAPWREDRFLAGSRFEDAVALYDFDKDLRLLLMDAIEQVEIALRVQLTMILGAQGAFAYLDPAHLDPRFVANHFADWSSKMQTMRDRSGEEFVRHYKTKYFGSPDLPIWMAAELWDFGMLSKLFSGLQIQDKRKLARGYGLVDVSVLESWLRTLNTIRNFVAHHSRTWNRWLSLPLKLPKHGHITAFNALHAHPNTRKRVYGVLCVLAHLLSQINPNSDWKNRVVALADSFPVMPHAKLSDMGFSPNWQAHLFWN